jgi:acetolactate synthase regulatory subunit
MSSPEAAVAEAVSATLSRFSVHARAEPGVMPRVLELFAKRGLVPECWHSTVARPGPSLTIDIEVDGIGRDTVEYVASCMRQIAGVELVLTV